MQYVRLRDERCPCGSRKLRRHCCFAFAPYHSTALCVCPVDKISPACRACHCRQQGRIGSCLGAFVAYCRWPWSSNLHHGPIRMYLCNTTCTVGEVAFSSLPTRKPNAMVVCPTTTQPPFLSYHINFCRQASLRAMALYGFSSTWTRAACVQSSTAFDRNSRGSTR